MEKEKCEEYKSLTHEELVLEVYRMMYKLSLKEQAQIVEKIKEAVKDE